MGSGVLLIGLSRLGGTVMKGGFIIGEYFEKGKAFGPWGKAIGPSFFGTKEAG